MCIYIYIYLYLHIYVYMPTYMRVCLIICIIKYYNYYSYYNTCCCLATRGPPLLFNTIFWSTVTLIFFGCICFCWIKWWWFFTPLLPLEFFLFCWLVVGVADVTMAPAVGVAICGVTVDADVLLEVDVVTSLKSGLGLFFVGKVCSRHPVPAARSSRSLVLRHFIRRFWNHIFTCDHRNSKK